jgi:DUF4097 and DUF4098 domain-containing protein YvlB
MKKPAAVFSLMLVSALNGPGILAGEDIDRTMAAVANGLVKVKNTRGEVDIKGWDQNEVHIEGELDDLAKELVFSQDGDTTVIEIRLPRKNVNWGDGSDLEIRVPSDSRVDFEGVSTDIKLTDIKGGIRVRSVSGDITVDHIETQVRLQSVSGDIDVEDSSGIAHMSTVSGEIDAEVNSEKVMLDTVSGEIVLGLGSFDQLRVNAVSGDIRVAGTLGVAGQIDIVSISGTVSVRLQESVSAHLIAETQLGGGISNALSDDEPTDTLFGRMALKATLGSGEGKINLRTVSGDIRIGSEN